MRMHLGPAALAVGSVLSLPGATRASGEPLHLSIQVVDYSDLRPTALTEAQHYVQQVFGSIGIATSWADKRPNDPQDDADVTILLLSREMSERHAARSTIPATVLASAAPRPAMRSWVYSDRVTSEAARLGCSLGMLLGDIVVHELGHIVAGLLHAPSGTMQPSAAVPIGGLIATFSSAEAEQLRRAVRIRTAAQPDGQPMSIASVRPDGPR